MAWFGFLHITLFIIVFIISVTPEDWSLSTLSTALLQEATLTSAPLLSSTAAYPPASSVIINRPHPSPDSLLQTETVFGFLNFTTTLGKNVMVFTNKASGNDKKQDFIVFISTYVYNSKSKHSFSGKQRRKRRNEKFEIRISTVN